MYATPKNILHKKPLILHICVICLHLTQRILTMRFFAGVLLGSFFTIIVYHHQQPMDNKPKFRRDQSKFEYEKNQLPSDDIDTSKSSTWNSSWDG